MGESVRVLVVVDDVVLDSEIMMFPPSVRTVCDPSSLILLHEIEGRGNPSAEHVNTASSGAITVTLTGGVVMTGTAINYGGNQRATGKR